MTIAAIPIAADVRVNSTINGTQIDPAVAALKGGGFVVTWTSQTVGSVDGNEVYAQRYDSLGVPQGSEFPVNSTSGGSQALSSVTALVDAVTSDASTILVGIAQADRLVAADAV